MAPRVVNPFVPSWGWGGKNAVYKLVAGRGGHWSILVCICVDPWGWRAMKMSSHFVGVEIVRMSDLFCDLSEFLQSKHVSHHEGPSRKDMDGRPGRQPRGQIGQIGQIGKFGHLGTEGTGGLGVESGQPVPSRSWRGSIVLYWWLGGDQYRLGPA